MRLRILFESKGIAIHIANEDSARNFGFILPPRKYEVFVVFEEQLEDALALLEDETHEVNNPIDLEDYQAYISEHQPDTTKKLFNSLMNLFLISHCRVYFYLHPHRLAIAKSAPAK